MCTGELGAKVQSGEWAGATPPWHTEHLYELVLTGSPGLLKELGAPMQRSQSHAWRLGSVEKAALTLDNESIDLKALSQAYQTGWSKHFAQLA
jgi:hypothetical protein